MSQLSKTESRGRTQDFGLEGGWRWWMTGEGRIGTLVQQLRYGRCMLTPMFRAGLMDLELQPTLASEKSIDFLPTLRVDFETD